MKKFISFLFVFMPLFLNTFSQKDENLIRILKKHQAPVTALSFSEDGKYLFTGGEDKVIFKWDLMTGDPAASITDNYFPVKFLQALNDQTILVASGPDVKLIDETGNIIRAFKGYTTHIWSFDMNVKNGKLIAGSYSGKILVWDFKTGDKLLTLEGHEKSTLPVCFSPDGKLAASGSLDRSVRIWNAETGEELRKMAIHSDNILAVQFHPSGKYVASASLDKTIRLWDVETGKLIMTYAGNDKPVLNIDFSSDGYYLASASQDNTVILWDVYTGNRIYSFIDHEAPVNVVKFSPDGKFLASGSSDNRVMIWDLNKKIFASYLFQDKMDEEIAGSDLFGPRRKEENRQQYEEREKEAMMKMVEINERYYWEYMELRKNGF